MVLGDPTHRVGKPQGEISLAPGAAESRGHTTTHLPFCTCLTRYKSEPFMKLLVPSQRTLPMMVSTWFFFSHAAKVLSSRLLVAVTAASSTCQVA